MRLGDHALPGEETVLRTEAEAIDVAAEARKRNGELDGFRIDRLAPLRREDAKLGLGAIFEYGHLDSEVAALEQAAAVGPFALFRSKEHTSELKSLLRISYAVFCLQKNNLTLTLATSFITF